MTERKQVLAIQCKARDLIKEIARAWIDLGKPIS